MAKHMFKSGEVMTRTEKKSFDKELTSIGVVYPKKRNRAYYQYKAEEARLAKMTTSIEKVAEQIEESH